jgi:fido (protein-threonine AMPylation protein)
MKFTYAVGATPIDADEAAGLIPSHIATQSDLNTWEEANILQGAAWAQRQKKRELLKEGFVRELHKQMFNRTWRWVGSHLKPQFTSVTCYAQHKKLFYMLIFKCINNVY